MAKEVEFTPENIIGEDDLVDKRHHIAENCFIEMDIALKAYRLSFGEDLTHDEISLQHTNIAYILSNHENEHKLSNINIDEFKIPNSPFNTESGEPTDRLYDMVDADKLHYVTNLLINSKAGISELLKSGYFEAINGGLMLETNALIQQVMIQYDRIILLMNNKYSKLILNIK